MKYEVVMSELLLNNNRISDLHFFFFFYENCKMAANAKWLVCGVLVWDSHSRRRLPVVATRLTGNPFTAAHSYTLTLNILGLGLDYYYFNIFIYNFLGGLNVWKRNSLSVRYVKMLKFQKDAYKYNFFDVLILQLKYFR